MFIVTKETIKDILKIGEEWQECIEKEDLISALAFFFGIPIYIFFIILAFLGDIVFSPLELIIYLKVRKIRNERKGELK